MSETDTDDSGALLDNLYIELFSLIEQQVSCKVQIEKHHNSGQMLLAKTRYIQGSQSIGIAQIPTELSSDFNALCKVNNKPCENTIFGKKAEMQKSEVDYDIGNVDPLKWFSALPSSSLRQASEQFKKCVELVVDSVNIQRQLQTTIYSISKLKPLIKIYDA